jgi:thiaminase
MKGELPHDKFRDYIIQDKIFCESFRCFVCQVLADCPKAEDFEVFHKLVADLQGYGHEAALFEEIFKMLNITKADMRAHPTTEAFNNFLWKVGTTGTLEDKLIVLYAVEGSYMEWAERGKSRNETPKNGVYAKWAEIHTAQNLGRLIDWVKKSLDELLGPKGEHITDTHHQLFQRALQYEIMFWDTAFMPGSSVFSGESALPVHRFKSGLNR